MLLCLLFNMLFTMLLFALLYPISFTIFSTISLFISISLSSTPTVLLKYSLNILLYHSIPFFKNGCFIISSSFILFFGFTFNIFVIKSLQLGLSLSGISKWPLNIFLYNLSLFLSSKGRYPHTIAYNTIPLDQISTIRPL